MPEVAEVVKLIDHGYAVFSRRILWNLGKIAPRPFIQRRVQGNRALRLFSHQKTAEVDEQVVMLWINVGRRQRSHTVGNHQRSQSERTGLLIQIWQKPGIITVPCLRQRDVGELYLK